MLNLVTQLEYTSRHMNSGCREFILFPTFGNKLQVPLMECNAMTPVQLDVIMTRSCSSHPSITIMPNFENYNPNANPVFDDAPFTAQENAREYAAIVAGANAAAETFAREARTDTRAIYTQARSPRTAFMDLTNVGR
jgi:hypothetical protein